jgi:hypothetical protein
MRSSNENYNGFKDKTESQQSEIESIISHTKSELNNLQSEVLWRNGFNNVEKIDQNVINGIKTIINESNLSNNNQYLNIPNFKESLVDYISKWKLNTKENMMLEFQLYNLAKQPQNWKLKYLMDHSKEPLSLVIKKINEKSGVVELFNKHSQYDHIINKYANENEVDPLLIKSIIYQESKFNTNARSWAGAWGLMQLTPITIKEIERTWNIKVKDVYNPEQNIMWGVKYISQLIKQFSWNIRIALAAYNAGPWNVRKYWNTIPPFKETKNYVKKIMNMYNTIKS